MGVEVVKSDAWRLAILNSYDVGIMVAFIPVHNGETTALDIFSKTTRDKPGFEVKTRVFPGVFETTTVDVVPDIIEKHKTELVEARKKLYGDG